MFTGSITAPRFVSCIAIEVLTGVIYDYLNRSKRLIECNDKRTATDKIIIVHICFILNERKTGLIVIKGKVRMVARVDQW